MFFNSRKIAVFIIKEETFGGLEDQTAWRVMSLLLSRGKGKNIDVFDIDSAKPLIIGDIPSFGKYDVYAVIKGIAFITRENIKNLSDIISKTRQFSAIAPVSNESRTANQRLAPPFLYQTLTVFKWASEENYRQTGNDVMQVDEIDDFCIVFRKEFLNNMPRDRNLSDLPHILKESSMRCGVAKGIYTHRYADCYESGREDLISHVPVNAKEILDIGCSRGLFGEVLKKRQKCTVTGIDFDSKLIAAAGERLDRVICGDVEKVIDNSSLGMFDCIVCGDVLEHLNNPVKVVRDLRDHLRKGGLFVASTPNVNNWAIIYDMLQGRWDYVPFSILSGTHIRFFTKQTLEELFEGAGYQVRDIFLQDIGGPPIRQKIIEKIKKTIAGVSEEELAASEIVIVSAAC